MATTDTGSKKPLLNNLLILFMVAMILANIAGNMYIPLLPLYLKSLDASVVQVGLFFTLVQIIPLLLQILGGWISDSLGRLRSIAFGSIAGVLSYIALILSPTWQWVLLGEGFASVTRSLIAPSFSAFIAEQSAEENRARVFGMVETLFMVVLIVGPPLGGFLVERYGFRWMLAAAGVFYLLATILRVGMARAAARGHESHRSALSLVTLRSNLKVMIGLIGAGGLLTWMLFTDGVRDVSFTMSFSLMPLYLESIGGMTVQQIGWLNAIFGVASMVTSIPAGWLADKKSERLAIALGFFLQALSLYIFLKTDTFVGFGASWALFGVGSSLMGPAYSSLISKAIPEAVRGTAFGLMSTSLGLFSLPAPAIGAQMYDRISPRLPFAITGIAALLSIIPVWFKFKLGIEKNKPAPELTPD